jgi:pectate lyase-like protein
MAKLTLNNLTNLSNQGTAVTIINENNDDIETALENTLSRDGTSPNTMGANLDMNSHRIINLPEPTSNFEPLRLIDANTLNGGGTIEVSSLPVGGTSGQVLTKDSNTDYDVSWQDAGSGGGTSSDILNILDFGADPTGVADSSVAIQAAIDSLPESTNLSSSVGGGAIFCPAGNYSLHSTVRLDRPLTFYGTKGTNMSAVDASTTLFDITHSFVTFQSFGSLGRPGTPSGTDRAIRVGAPVRIITDAFTTNGSTTLTSATANFTSADINKSIFITGQGLNSIAGVSASNQITLGAAASATASGLTCIYSFSINDVLIDDIGFIINHTVGIELSVCQKCVVRAVRTYTTYGLLQSCEIWGDLGDNAISDCTFQSTNDTTGAGVVVNSGGGAKYSNCKILGGRHGVNISWQATSTSSGPWFSNCSIENATHSNFYVACFTAQLYNIKVTGCEFFASNATNIMFDNGTVSPVGASFIGNITQNGASNNHYNILKLDHGIFANNFDGFGNNGISISLGANTNDCYVDLGIDMVGSVQFVDSGTNNHVEHRKSAKLRRYAKAALPSAAAAEHLGNLVYVTDEAGGAVPAFCDGTNWRRVTDRAVVS